jgi:hypothetical protein
MEIILIENSQDKEPTTENPGHVLWKGRTDTDAESPLPASLLAAVFDVGRWYRVSDFSERWISTPIEEGGDVTEVAVKLLTPATGATECVSQRDIGRILVQTNIVAKSVVEELLTLAHLFNPELHNLWVRLD